MAKYDDTILPSLFKELSKTVCTLGFVLQAANLLTTFPILAQALTEAVSGKSQNKAQKAMSKLQRLPVPNFLKCAHASALPGSQVSLRSKVSEFPCRT